MGFDPSTLRLAPLAQGGLAQGGTDNCKFQAIYVDVARPCCGKYFTTIIKGAIKCLGIL